MFLDHVRIFQRAEHGADPEIDTRPILQREDHRSGVGLRIRDYASRSDLRGIPVDARCEKHARRRMARDRLSDKITERPRIRFQICRRPGQPETREGEILLLRFEL